MITIELKGWKEAVRMFENLGEVGGQALYKAIVETAITAVSTMKENTPVQTNRLRASEHWETPKSNLFYYADNGGHGFTGAFKTRLSGLAVAFGTNVHYAKQANEKSSRPGFYEKSQSKAKIVLPERMAKNYQKAVDQLQNKTARNINKNLKK